MSSIRLRGPIVLAKEIWDDAELVIEDGKIAEIQSRPFHATYTARVTDRLLAPGLIDTHIHGSVGVDVMDGTAAALHQLAGFLVTQGTTAFLPTTLSAAHEDLVRVLTAVEAVRSTPASHEATILGVHLEGPYLHPDQAGAQNPAWVRPPDAAELAQYLQATWVRIVTAAPELPGFADLAGMVRAYGGMVSLGHTTATWEETRDAIERYGIRHATHLFNGMAPPHHRHPGPAGAALATPTMWWEVIADGIHVHPMWIQMVATLGPDRVVLVTDAMRAAGLRDGTYALGGLSVTVAGGVARTGTGHLAGSTLSLIRAVVNYRAWTGCGWSAACRAGSLTPARMLGVAQTKGSLAVGKDADVIVVDPATGTVEATWIGGQRVWEAGMA